MINSLQAGVKITKEKSQKIYLIHIKFNKIMDMHKTKDKLIKQEIKEIIFLVINKKFQINNKENNLLNNKLYF